MLHIKIIPTTVLVKNFSMQASNLFTCMQEVKIKGCLVYTLENINFVTVINVRDSVVHMYMRKGHTVLRMDSL